MQSCIPTYSRLKKQRTFDSSRFSVDGDPNFMHLPFLAVGMISTKRKHNSSDGTDSDGVKFTLEQTSMLWAKKSFA